MQMCGVFHYGKTQCKYKVIVISFFFFLLISYTVTVYIETTRWILREFPVHVVVCDYINVTG